MYIIAEILVKSRVIAILRKSSFLFLFFFLHLRESNFFTKSARKLLIYNDFEDFLFVLNFRFLFLHLRESNIL